MSRPTVGTEKSRHLETLAAHLAKVPGSPAASECADVAHRVDNLAARLDSLAVAECDRSLSAAEEAERERLFVQIRRLLAPWAPTVRPHLDGDPRGFVVKLRGLPGNTWGGDEVGFGIGWR